MSNRKNIDEYFMAIANVVKTRSTCLRKQVGAVLVKNNQIISTGYNGSPSKTEHCETKGCLRQQLNIPSGKRHEICRGAHAEQNAIAQAARNGVSTEGSVIYITHSPCSMCAKIIINSGITKIIFNDDYPDDLGKQLLSEAGIEAKHISEINKDYENEFRKFLKTF